MTCPFQKTKLVTFGLFLEVSFAKNKKKNTDNDEKPENRPRPISIKERMKNLGGAGGIKLGGLKVGAKRPQKKKAFKGPDDSKDDESSASSSAGQRREGGLGALFNPKKPKDGEDSEKGKKPKNVEKDDDEMAMGKVSGPKGGRKRRGRYVAQQT